MAQKTGTYDISSLLAAKNASAVEFGLDTIAATLAADNTNYNAMVQSALADLVATTSDRQRVAGSSVGGDMMEADEYSRVPTQKDVPSYLMGFPLRKMQWATGWTSQWIKKATPADFAIKQQAAQGADLRRLRYELTKALFFPTNTTFIDLNVDKASLSVKALINADSSAIQSGPNGEAFDGASHTHYNANGTLTAAAIQALIDDVVEHGFGQVKVFINVANEAAFRLLAGFVGYLDPRVSINANANQANQTRLDITRMDNRPIGIFGAAEVWVKPWIPANYAAAADTSTAQKPLVMRTDSPDLGLHIEAQLDTHPLHAQYFEHQYGFGAWNRLAAAVLEFDNGAYGAPTLSY